MKIRYKLSLLIFLLIVLVSSFSYLLLAQTVKSLLVRRLENAEAQIGMSLARRIYRQVIEKDHESVTALLFREKISKNNQLRYLVVRDRDGNLFAHTFLDRLPDLLKNLSDEFAPDQDYRIDDLLNTSLGVYNIGVPIREGIIQVGVLHIGISRTFVTEAVSPLKRATEKLVLFGCIVVVVGAGLSFGLSFAITKSITQLQKWARQLSRGDFDIDFTVNGSDEIAVLAQSFKQMRDHLREARNRLELQNKNLEQLVGERTAELENNNRELLLSHARLEELNRDLDRQRENLRIVFSAMTNPLYVINLDYTIAMMNDVARSRVAEDAPLPLTCHQVAYHLAGPCRETANTCPMTIIKETKKPVTLEHVYTGSDKQERYIEVHAYPIFGEEGELLQIVETCIDVTDKKRAEEERFQIEKEMHRVQKLESIGTLAAGIAHEINTPIQFIGDNMQFAEESIADLFRVIAAYKELVRKVQSGTVSAVDEAVSRIDSEGDLDYYAEELPRAIQQSKDGTEHVRKIVSAMKDFSHIGSQEEMQPANINHALETTLTISRNEWKYVADVKLDLDPDLPPVDCFEGELKQVFLNLIINGAHAISDRQLQEGSKEKGLLTVATSSTAEHVIIAVRDNGSGIPEEYRARIFDPFFTTKDVGKGTGQGLSVAYQIVAERHGGKIWFETEFGRGTSFFISLKRKRDKRLQG